MYRKIFNSLILYLIKNKKNIILVFSAILIESSTLYIEAFDQHGFIPAIYSFSFLTLFFAIFLTKKFIWLSIIFSYSALAVINHINEIKIKFLFLPISSDDLKILYLHPSLLLNILGLNNINWDFFYAITLISLALTLLILIFKLSKSLKIKGAFKNDSLNSINKLIYAFLIFAVSEQALLNYALFLKNNLPVRYHKQFEDFFLPESQVTFSRQIGVIEYITYTSLLTKENPIIHSYSEIKFDKILKAAKTFINQKPSADKILPNIVLVHLESTFDPNLAFRLNTHIDLPVWTKLPDTQMLKTLRVSIVGGGSWVTDFEVLTGIDSKSFGFQGFYAPYYVSPLIKKSFPLYLLQKNYTTTAFYTVNSDYYNSKNAFLYYGFQDLFDGPQLGMNPHWSKFNDRDFIKSIIDTGVFTKTKDSQPFLYYIETLENHGPHLCKNFTSIDELQTKFSDTSDFDINCQLNEYIRRAHSTSEGLLLILEQLHKIKQETGRPFVLAIYGDHQPWNFTNGKYSIGGGLATEVGFYNFDIVRKDASKYETFFHVFSSESGLLKDYNYKNTPSYVLPSLLSLYVADSYNDVYFPENLYLLKRCGNTDDFHKCSIYKNLSTKIKNDALGLLP